MHQPQTVIIQREYTRRIIAKVNRKSLVKKPNPNFCCFMACCLLSPVIINYTTFGVQNRLSRSDPIQLDWLVHPVTPALRRASNMKLQGRRTSSLWFCVSSFAGELLEKFLLPLNSINIFSSFPGHACKFNRSWPRGSVVPNRLRLIFFLLVVSRTAPTPVEMLTITVSVVTDCRENLFYLIAYTTQARTATPSWARTNKPVSAIRQP